MLHTATHQALAQGRREDPVLLLHRHQLVLVGTLFHHQPCHLLLRQIHRLHAPVVQLLFEVRLRHLLGIQAGAGVPDIPRLQEFFYFTVGGEGGESDGRLGGSVH